MIAMDVYIQWKHMQNKDTQKIKNVFVSRTIRHTILTFHLKSRKTKLVQVNFRSEIFIWQ